MLTSVSESANDSDPNNPCKQRLRKRSADTAKSNMSPTYRELTSPSLPPTPASLPSALALGNPNSRASLTTATSITTTSKAAPIKSASSVRAHTNLIGKMINTAIDTVTDVSSSTSETPMIDGDFHDDDADNNNNSGSSSSSSTTTTTIDTDNALINKQQCTALAALPLGRARQEQKSKLTTTVEAEITTTTTTADTQTKRSKKLHESQAAASSDKSEPIENKCTTRALQTLSSQRKVELNRSQTPQELDLIAVDVSTHRKGLNERQRTQLSFAERNQKLKADFLAASSENAAGANKVQTANQDCKDRTTTRRRAAQHLKLNISAASNQASAVLEAVLEPSKLTLVARRKLELKRRFDQQIQAQCSEKLAITTVSPHFPNVQKLRQRFDQQPIQTDDKMIVQPQKLSDTASPENSAGNYLALKAASLEQRQSPLSDEGCNLGQSPYSSDEDNVSIRTTSTTVERKRKDKVARSASSDSALGLDVDEPEQPVQHDKQRRMTLTVTDLPLRPALLPLAEPTALPDSPTSDAPINLPSQATIPSKVLLEERVVEIPEDPRSTGSFSSSRRESAQSCLSDYPPSECAGVRFVRTPSVVVSDYSDDVMCGITLEEIEYFRAQRLRRRRSSLDTASGTEKDGIDGGAHSDVSASSSCSNLYYCGSTISALDGAECYVNGMRMPLAVERKASACSTCSASGGEEEDAVYSIPEQPEEADGQLGKDLAELLAAQQLHTKRPKKVGMCEKCTSARLGGGD